MQKIFDLIFYGEGRKAIIARVIFVFLCIILIGGLLFIILRWPESIIIAFAAFILIMILAYIVQRCIDLVAWIKHGD